MSSDWVVDGLRARSQSEYEAFLRDKRQIDAILKKIDTRYYKQLEKLYSSLCVGSVKFESRLGFEFEDQISDEYNNRTNKIPSNRRSSVEIKPKEVEESEENVDKDLVEYYLKKRQLRNTIFKYVVIIGSVFLIITSGFFMQN